MNHLIDPREAFRIPATGDGARIGLFGGSFNPPHEGHLNLCDIAFKKLELDQIWWLVTPGNPLKDTSTLPDLESRIEKCRALVNNPSIRITALEAVYNTRYTADIVEQLLLVRPRLQFVWLMGADNLAQFHEWQDWTKIVQSMPVAVIDRPGSTLAFRSSRAAHVLSRFRVRERDAKLLATMKPPAWTFVHGPRNRLSSTYLRTKAGHNSGG